MLGVGLLKATNNFKTFFITANATDVVLLTLAGTPTVKGKFRFVVQSGVTIGQVNSSVAALSVGAFPSGSEIELYNNGSIQGKGGTGAIYTTATLAGGNGGDCIMANYANQIVRIVNNGDLRAGGAGAGTGGAGGAGGTGGRGDINHTFAWFYSTDTAGRNEWVVNSDGTSDIYWFGEYIDSASSSDTVKLASRGLYERGALVSADSYYVRLNQLYSGATGGGATRGGRGGDGTGYNQTFTTGGTGLAGVNGGVGTNGAGSGGASGAGGTGGTGGDWGSVATVSFAGAVGAAGTTGTAGGVSESGTAGTAGDPAGASGTAGRVLVMGSSSVTFTNNGTVYGLIV